MSNQSNSQEFTYMLLSRLQSDCKYFLGYGGRSERVLWAGSVEEQISEMKKLWNELEVKPEWLTLSDIDNYYELMK